MNQDNPFETEVRGFYEIDRNLKKYKPLPTLKTNEKIEKLKKEIEIEEAKDDPILKDTGNVIVKKSSHTFWKFLGIMFLILLIGIAYLIFFTDYGNGLISPSFNATINNDFNNQFENNVNNQYEHTIDNNFTIINKIYNNCSG